MTATASQIIARGAELLVEAQGCDSTNEIIRTVCDLPDKLYAAASLLNAMKAIHRVSN